MILVVVVVDETRRFTVPLFIGLDRLDTTRHDTKYDTLGNIGLRLSALHLVKFVRHNL